MTDLEQQLRDIFRERSESATPDPDLHAVMSGASRVTVTGTWKQSSSTRHLLLKTAAAVMLVGLGATAIGYGIRPTSDSTSTHVTYPDVIPPAPNATDGEVSATHFLALTVDDTTQRLASGPHNDTLVGDAGGSDSPWGRWTSASGSVIDADATTLTGLYIITCCSPGGVIWANGVRLADGTHIDYLWNSSGFERVWVDPVTSTVTKGRTVPLTKIVEPGAIDVALLDGQTMGILVGGSTPKLVITTGSAVGRREIALPAGPVEPCAVVALEDRFVVLVGAPRGNDPCVGDRALIVDGLTGRTTETLRMPAEVRGFNSDHVGQLIAVTVEGNVVLGDFRGRPNRWITLLKGHYVAAAMS